MGGPGRDPWGRLRRFVGLGSRRRRRIGRLVAIRDRDSVLGVLVGRWEVECRV